MADTLQTYLDNNKTRQTKYSVSAYPSSSEVEDGEKALIQQPWTGSGGQKVEGAIDGMHQALRAITNERETVVAEQHQVRVLKIDLQDEKTRISEIQLIHIGIVFPCISRERREEHVPSECGREGEGQGGRSGD